MILYKPGKSNTIIDALSRRNPYHLRHTFFLTNPSFDSLNSLLTEGKTFLSLQALHSELTLVQSRHRQFKITKGILYHTGRPYLSKHSALKPLFL